MNKKFIAAIVAAICISIPAGVSADNADRLPEQQDIDISKLNDTQKADLKAQLEKMMQLKKETVQKMMDNGSISKEQGEKMMEKLDIRLKSIQEGNLEIRKNKEKCPDQKGDKSPKKNNSKSKTGE